MDPKDFTLNKVRVFKRKIQSLNYRHGIFILEEYSIKIKLLKQFILQDNIFFLLLSNNFCVFEIVFFIHKKKVLYLKNRFPVFDGITSFRME